MPSFAPSWATFIFSAATALSVGVGGAACSSSDDNSNGSSSNGTGTSASTACASDTRKDVYADGIEKTTAKSAMKLRLSGANPAPPQKGTNDMTLDVLDASGAPVDGASIIVTPFMPDHGHGSAVTPTVTSVGGGKYTVSKVYLPMAGLWQITFKVSKTDGTSDDGVFQFCLDG